MSRANRHIPFAIASRSAGDFSRKIRAITSLTTSALAEAASGTSGTRCQCHPAVAEVKSCGARVDAQQRQVGHGRK
jgi:hypothetical protein